MWTWIQALTAPACREMKGRTDWMRLTLIQFPLSTCNTPGRADWLTNGHVVLMFSLTLNMPNDQSIWYIIPLFHEVYATTTPLHTLILAVVFWILHIYKMIAHTIFINDYIIPNPSFDCNCYNLQTSLRVIGSDSLKCNPLCLMLGAWCLPNIKDLVTS